MIEAVKQGLEAFRHPLSDDDHAVVEWTSTRGRGLDGDFVRESDQGNSRMPLGFFARVVGRDYVHHSELRMEQHGLGIGTAFVKHSFDVYRSVGVRSVTVSPVDDGKIVWAKLGFSFNNYPYGVEQTLDDMLYGYKELGRTSLWGRDATEEEVELAAQYLKKLKTGDLEPWQLAETEVGRFVLDNGNWEGIYHL